MQQQFGGKKGREAEIEKVLSNLKEMHLSDPHLSTSDMEKERQGGMALTPPREDDYFKANRSHTKGDNMAPNSHMPSIPLPTHFTPPSSTDTVDHNRALKMHMGDNMEKEKMFEGGGTSAGGGEEWKKPKSREREGEVTDTMAVSGSGPVGRVRRRPRGRGRTKRLDRKELPSLGDQAASSSEDTSSDEDAEHKNLRSCKSQQDLLRLIWNGRKQNLHGELETVELRTMMADMGICSLDDAIADLHKRGDGTRAQWGSFYKWWQDHGHSLLDHRIHGQFFYLEFLRNFYNKGAGTVNFDSLCQALLACPAPSLSTGEARSRVENWFKHVGWNKSKSYSFLRLMRLFTFFDPKSLHCLFPVSPPIGVYKAT